MSTTVACRIFMLVAALLLAPGLGLAQEKVPSEGTPPPPQTNLGTLPGTGCNDSGGTDCPSDTIPNDDPGNPVVSTFTFSGCTNIEDVNVGLDITHTWIGDLIVDVEGPSGGTVRLLDRPGLPGQNQNFGCNDNDVFAVLDDEGTEPAEDACPHIEATPGLSGDLTPTQLLSAFDGLSADGEWTLRVSDNASGDEGNLTDWTLEITCAQQSDLAVEKTATVNEDATVDFAITVANNGPADASGVEVSDPLPACVTYQSDDCGAGDGDPFTWTIGDLFVQGPPVTCTVTVDASGCAGEGEQVNAATVTADQDDPEPDNDTGEATFEITETMADLAVDKTATVNEDGTVDFAITVTNVGPDDATGVEVSDSLPACTSYQSDDCGAGEGDPFTWAIGDLAVEASASCTVVVDAAACAGEGEQTNTATATAEQADPVPDNDSGEATFEIGGIQADLSLSQQATVGAAAAGASQSNATSQIGEKGVRAAGEEPRVENGVRAAANGDATVVLALEVTNAGPADATGVTVTNELPECTQVVSDDCDGDAGPPWTWTIGDLAVDASASCNLTVDASQCSGVQTVTGQVSADQSDPNPDDNTAAATFEIEVVPALPALALVLLAALLALIATRLLRRNRVPEPPFGG